MAVLLLLLLLRLLLLRRRRQECDAGAPLTAMRLGNQQGRVLLRRGHRMR